MDGSTYRLRPPRPEDYAAEAAIASAVDPGRVFSVEEFQRFESVFSPPFVFRKIVAEESSSGQAVGFGYLQSDLESFDPGTFHTGVHVEPARQGRGIGLALAEALAGEARRLGATRLWAGARSDDRRAMDFLARQGFQERRRNWRAWLDLAEAVSLPDRSSELAQRGISFTTLADWPVRRPAVDRELYELSVATTADEPRIGSYTPIPFEKFVVLEFEGGTFLPEAYFLARAGDKFVGMSVLRRAEHEPRVLQQAFTGTLSAYRGMGIATELKRRAVEYGRHHGYTSIRTGNDSLNAPMLAINRKLGFRKDRERVWAEKRLTPSPPSA